MSARFIGFYTATAIVIANMIGSGVFTSLGFQVLEIHSVFALMMLWAVGGVVALCGSLTYGALASAMPHSGGEYYYLSRIYHPAVGFLSGWVSMTVGFPAPVALSAMLLSGYASRVFPSVNGIALASAVVVVFTLIHSTNIKVGRGVQNTFTAVKILLILFIIFSGISISSPVDFAQNAPENGWSEIFSPAFAVALYWVSYSYSGWNASAYIAGEVESPEKNVPASLLSGTIAVTCLYVMLNFVFLYTSPAHALAGQKEVGYVAAGYIFGETGGKIISAIIAVLLLSSVSSMIIAGPRVTQMMGEDFNLLKIFAKKNNWNIPYFAVIFQSLISLFMLFTASFESILIYIGFTLSIFTFLTVLGIFLLKGKTAGLPEKIFKGWGFPVVPAVFLTVTAWIIYEGIIMKPHESMIGVATVLTGLIFYFLSGKRYNITTQQ